MGTFREITNSEFYPTPEELAEKMVAKINRKALKETVYLLEPSAGSGDLIYAVGKHLRYYHLQVDFIEKAESLRRMTMQRFSEEECFAKQEKAYRAANENASDAPMLNEELDTLRLLTNTHCVGDDFLFFETFKKYDVILMNPPFSEGAIHLLKAIELQRRFGGQIICLLNAQSIRNPHTPAQKELVKQLQELSADIEYVSDAFCIADRTTDVEVAVISLMIEEIKQKSGLLEGLKKEEEREEKAANVDQMIPSGDIISEMLQRFQFEQKVAYNLYTEYQAMLPYCMPDFDDSSMYRGHLITMKFADGSSFYDYVKALRRIYWGAFFNNPALTSMFTSAMRNQFNTLVSEMEGYDFTRFNIMRIREKMNTMLKESYEDTIVSLFDKLSCTHAYTGLPEEINVHYYNGWRTNKAWKINEKKVILPAYGAFDGYFTTAFSARNAYDILSDIEKTLNYLDGGETPEASFSLSKILDAYNGKDSARNIHTKYFSVTFYKKGTCHITWNDPWIIQKLNLYGSKKRGWLPPGYGSKPYSDLSKEERDVVDAFQGRELYEKIAMSGNDFDVLPFAM